MSEEGKENTIPIDSLSPQQLITVKKQLEDVN